MKPKIPQTIETHDYESMLDTVSHLTKTSHAKGLDI